MSNRIIALIDMDCFYCQVECKINPSLHGRPLAVVQYNTWKGGGIIAVNYEARNRGVTRHMRGDEAKQHCPEIELCRVPSVRGKADISKYRNAGREVIAVLSEFSNVVERASIDEAYIDLTEVVHERVESIGRIASPQLSNTFVVGYGPDNNDEVARSAGVSEWLSQVYSDVDASVMDNTEDFLELAVAGVIVEEIRAAVLSKTQFHCSAGIAHNKVLAKLVCGLHKPRKQSILPNCSIPMLYSSLSIKKIRHLGGKLGDDVVEKLQCSTMLEVEKFSLKQLQAQFEEKTASWLYHIARGIDNEPVNARLVSKSVGCCKRFPGKTCLASRTEVAHWIQELADEICERLEDDLTLNKRRAQLLTVSFTQDTEGKINSCSRSTPLPSYKLQDLVDVSMQVINKTNSAPANADVWSPPLLFLGLSASKFSASGSHQSIQQFFKPLDQTETASTPSTSFSSSALNNKHNPQQEQAHSYFNKLSPFQLELSKLEKKLAEKFHRYIDRKVKSYANGNLDKLVLNDIAAEIKTNTTESLKKYLKCEDESELDRKEKSVTDKLKADIDKSLKDIGDIFRGEGDTNGVAEKSEADSNKFEPSASCSNEDGFNSEDRLNKMDEQSAGSSNVSITGYLSVNTPDGKIELPRVTDKHSDNLQQSVVSVQPNSVESSQTIENTCDFITYTRRQINPEHISDVLSETDCPSPQIISKTVESIPRLKYETVEKKQADMKTHLSNLFKNAKNLPIKKEPGANVSTDSNVAIKKEPGVNVSTDSNAAIKKEPGTNVSNDSNAAIKKELGANVSTDSNKREKSYSFFESYLRRKKEKERQNLTSKCRDSQMLRKDEETAVPSVKFDENSDSMDSYDMLESNELHQDDFKSCDSVPADSNAQKLNDINRTGNTEISMSNEPNPFRIEGVHNTCSDLENESSNVPNSNVVDTFSTREGCDDAHEVTCDKCNTHIDIIEIQEHQDYHFALELSNSISPSPVQNNLSRESSSSKILNKKSSKRGRPSKLNSFQNSNSFKKLKTLDAFFKPGNSSLS